MRDGAEGEDANDFGRPLPAAVLFDAVGTLLYADPPVAVAYERVGRRHGSRRTLEEIDRSFREVFAGEERADAADREGRTDEAREERRWRSIVARVFDDVAAADPAALEGLFHEMWRHFARPESWRLFEGTERLLQTLGGRGHRLGVASNFDARLETIVAALLPEIGAEYVFASSKVGYRKPAAGFFRECERRLGIPAEKILLVGDDVANDFYGARQAGWRALLVDRSDRRPDLSPRIRNWDQLINAIDADRPRI